MLEINKIKFRFGWAKEMFEFQTKFDIIPNLSYLQISKNWKNESFFFKWSWSEPNIVDILHF